MNNAPAHNLTVLYDGACPLCSREISFYRRQRGAAGITWLDVSQAPNGTLPPSLSRQDALARFHVVKANGEIASGAAAFVALWSALPAFGVVGWLFRPRWATSLLERAYLMFLHIRPRLHSILARRSERVG